MNALAVLQQFCPMKEEIWDQKKYLTLAALFVQILKTLVVALLVAGVIPLLLGLLFELVIVAPLRVPLDQTPLFYPWQV